MGQSRLRSFLATLGTVPIFRMLWDSQPLRFPLSARKRSPAFMRSSRQVLGPPRDAEVRVQSDFGVALTFYA